MRKVVFETMADYGGFDCAADDGWGCQADLEKKNGAIRPTDSTCRPFPRELLSEWGTEIDCRRRVLRPTSQSCRQSRCVAIKA
jgi:hypothetical protein